MINIILLAFVKKIARKYYGGHFSIYWFTTGVKGHFETYEPIDYTMREFYNSLPNYKTLSGLLIDMIIHTQYHEICFTQKLKKINDKI